jgi:uncharacterized protein YutE (UPF0331/DUF86 family)
VDLLLAEKISRLGEYLEYLEELKNCSLEDYLSDYKIRGASERFMQLAIESIIDIGNEIISVLKLKRAERYRGSHSDNVKAQVQISCCVYLRRRLLYTAGSYLRTR